ncbi:MAG TPA: hypothetical protein PKE45_00175, partial [Caldilineaceae bacterium]|nr:hypothetical protein [Caldilineaceae bacterium]
RLLVEAMRSLQRRSLLESDEAGFGLQNVVLEYTSALLIEQIVRELLDDQMISWLDDEMRSPTEPQVIGSSGHPVNSSHLNRCAWILAQLKEYVRMSQTRQLLQPVAERLVAQLGSVAAAQRLQELVALWRKAAPHTPGYAAANLLHLLLQLGVELDGYDFSQLTVWRAYLRGAALPRVNFAGADLSGAVFTERLGRIFTVAFSPDGRWLAAGTREGAIHLWRTADQQLVQVIHAHNNSICSLAFYQHPAAEGQPHLWLASAGEDQTVGLWQATDAIEQGWHGQLLHGHQQCVTAVGFSADGQRLGSVDMDGVVLLWEVGSPLGAGRLMRSFSSHPTLPRGVAFSHQGQLLAISGDGVVRLWQVRHDEAESGPDEDPVAPILVLNGHTDRVSSVAFSPDDRTLASGGRDGRICLWSLPEGQLQQVLDTTYGIVTTLAFSPDGQTLASAHWDRTVRLWALGSGQLRQTLVGHAHVIQSVAFHPRPEGARHILASGGSDQMVRLWDAQTGQALNTLRGHHFALNAIALSHDGRWLAAVGYDQLVHLWSWQGGSSAVAQRSLRGHSGLLHTVAFSPDGQMLASAGRDLAIQLWDVASGQVRQTLFGHTQDIYRVAFHPDGELLASASADGTVRLWHWRSSQPVGTLAAGPGMVYTLAFSPDGQTLASAGVGQTIRLWDMTQPHYPERIAARIELQGTDVREIVALAFSQDGARLAAGSTHLVYVSDAHSGAVQATLRQHFDWVMSVAFSPDGMTLASASEDRT